MQGLSKLERAPVERPRKRAGRAKWGAVQRLLLAGALVTVIGLGLVGYFYSIRPSPPDLGGLPPYDAWVLWQEYRQGPRGRLDWERHYDEHRSWHRRWMVFAGVVVGMGMLTMVSALMVPRPQPARRARPPGRRARRPPEAASG